MKWARLDSNQRRHKPSDLQSDPFGHFGTRPEGADCIGRGGPSPHGESITPGLGAPRREVPEPVPRSAGWAICRRPSAPVVPAPHANRPRQEPPVGIEPTTYGLQNRCSTAELWRPVGLPRGGSRPPTIRKCRGWDSNPRPPGYESSALNQLSYLGEGPTSLRTRMGIGQSGRHDEVERRAEPRNRDSASAAFANLSAFRYGVRGVIVCRGVSAGKRSATQERAFAPPRPPIGQAGRLPHRMQPDTMPVKAGSAPRGSEKRETRRFS